MPLVARIGRRCHLAAINQPVFDMTTALYKERSTAEPHIKGGKKPLNWTRVRPTYAPVAVRDQGTNGSP